MSAHGIRPIVSEYRLFWEALKHFEERIIRLSSMSTDADQQLEFDEKRRDLAGILGSLRIAARQDFQLELG